MKKGFMAWLWMASFMAGVAFTAWMFSAKDTGQGLVAGFLAVCWCIVGAAMISEFTED